MFESLSKRTVGAIITKLDTQEKNHKKAFRILYNAAKINLEAFDTSISDLYIGLCSEYLFRCVIEAFEEYKSKEKKLKKKETASDYIATHLHGIIELLNKEEDRRILNNVYELMEAKIAKSSLDETSTERNQNILTFIQSCKKNLKNNNQIHTKDEHKKIAVNHKLIANVVTTELVKDINSDIIFNLWRNNEEQLLILQHALFITIASQDEKLFKQLFANLPQKAAEYLFNIKIKDKEILLYFLLSNNYSKLAHELLQHAVSRKYFFHLTYKEADEFTILAELSDLIHMLTMEEKSLSAYFLLKKVPSATKTSVETLRQDLTNPQELTRLWQNYTTLYMDDFHIKYPEFLTGPSEATSIKDSLTLMKEFIEKYPKVPEFFTYKLPFLISSSSKDKTVEIHLPQLRDSMDYDCNKLLLDFQKVFQDKDFWFLTRCLSLSSRVCSYQDEAYSKKIAYYEDWHETTGSDRHAVCFNKISGAVLIVNVSSDDEFRVLLDLLHHPFFNLEICFSILPEIFTEILKKHVKKIHASAGNDDDLSTKFMLAKLEFDSKKQSSLKTPGRQVLSKEVTVRLKNLIPATATIGQAYKENSFYDALALALNQLPSRLKQEVIEDHGHLRSLLSMKLKEEEIPMRDIGMQICRKFNVNLHIINIKSDEIKEEYLTADKADTINSMSESSYSSGNIIHLICHNDFFVPLFPQHQQLRNHPAIVSSSPKEEGGDDNRVERGFTL